MTTTGPDTGGPFQVRSVGNRIDREALDGYLRARGLLSPDTAVRAVEPLSGGVSADIVAVDTGSQWWVVKQVLPQLKVDQTWRATQRRAITEARAMEVAGELLSDIVPALVFVDPVDFVTVQQRAPRALADWRTTLLAGPAARDVRTARALGHALAVLHSGTVGRPELDAHFGDRTALTELRIEPFHHTVASALPAVATRLHDLARELVECPRCLVHGDFSPKNVLADGPQVRVLDWEVAHLGNPVFDVAFLMAHLVCKAVHRPASAAGYAECAREFHGQYARFVDPALRSGDQSVAAHIAAVVLARTDGKSPAGYLTAEQTAVARHHALRWLSDPATRPADVWSDLL